MCIYDINSIRTYAFHPSMILSQKHSFLIWNGLDWVYSSPPCGKLKHRRKVFRSRLYILLVHFFSLILYNVSKHDTTHCFRCVTQTKYVSQHKVEIDNPWFSLARGYSHDSNFESESAERACHSFGSGGLEAAQLSSMTLRLLSSLSCVSLYNLGTPVLSKSTSSKAISATALAARNI